MELELIVSDGGSTDGSVATAHRLGAKAPFPVRVVQGDRGRGGQLNRGAAAAQGENLLFLHADSRFPEPLALRRALDAVAAARKRHGESVAGRFSLTFDFPDGTTPRPYRFYEAKARLDRPGCTHGDQGFLMPRTCFERFGPFREDLPFMEDTFLAERIRKDGTWLLFPTPIRTSPRRFLTEGLLPRQTLNAVLMNLAFIGRLDLLDDLERHYRGQNVARRLGLNAFLPALKDRITALSPKERWRFWTRTGGYVRSQAWQVPFLIGLLWRGDGEGPLLRLHDRFFDQLTDHAMGRGLAAALTWGWFQVVARRKG